MEATVSKLNISKLKRVWNIGRTIWAQYDGQIMSLGDCESVEDAKFWVLYMENLKISKGEKDG